MPDAVSRRTQIVPRPDPESLLTMIRSVLAGTVVPTGPASPDPVALTVNGLAVVAWPSRILPGRLAQLDVVGPGGFVEGPDNAVFGRWNGLVAIEPRNRRVRLLPGHGGEIIPGRLADHVHAIKEGLRLGSPRPAQLDLDISMACPSACTFCFSADYRAARPDGRLMSAEAIRRTIVSSAELGVSLVRFDGGGDPLSSPHLSVAVELCRTLGLRTALLTAGDLLRPEVMPPLVAAATYVRVSLNAGSDATRAVLHRTSSARTRLSAVLRHVAELDRRRRSAYGSAVREVMPLGATCMIVPQNLAETVEVATAARAAGIDHISFRVVLGQQHAAAFTTAEIEEFRRQREVVEQTLVDEDFQAFFPSRALSDEGYVPGRYFSQCRASTHRALVEVGPDPDAPALVPCGRYRGHGYLYGRRETSTVFAVLEPGRTLSDAWMSPEMTRTVARFPASCGDCIDRSANLMLGGMAEVLSADPDARFLRFSPAQSPVPARRVPSSLASSRSPKPRGSSATA